MRLKAGNKDGKFSVGVVLLIAVLLLSFAYAASFSLAVSDRTPPAVISASAQGGPAPSILSASVEPEKVRPGDSMLVSAQVSDPSGISQVSAGMGGIETVPFISIAHYTGWWNYG